MLFDLIRDPSETTNIAAQQPDIVKSIKVRLVEFRESCKHSLAGKDYAVPFTPDKARLRVARYGGRRKDDIHPSEPDPAVRKRSAVSGGLCVKGRPFLERMNYR